MFAGGTPWWVDGNAGTNPATDFIGTTDNVPLLFRANGTSMMRLSYGSSNNEGNLFSGNIVAGNQFNSVDSGAVGCAVFGGYNIDSETVIANTAYDFCNSVSGGAGNTVGTNNSVVDVFYASIAGGLSNNARSSFSSVLGGGFINAMGTASTVAGGYGNTASAPYSFAAGRDAYIHASHEGTFVRSSPSDVEPAFESTAARQFLVRAAGRVGLGTNGPRGQLGVSSAGSFVRPHCTINETTAAYSRLAFTNPTSPRFWHTSATPTSVSAAADRMNVFHSSAGNVTQIVGDGRVGIGVATPAVGARLNVNGAVRCTSLVQTSSERYRCDVADIEPVADRLAALRPVRFMWDTDHGGAQDVGLIAEEVAGVFPDAVASVDGVVEGVHYSRLTAYTVQAFKEQQARLRAVESENADLRARLDRIERAFLTK